ncbi:MAG: hypothetical protein EOM54_10415 [Clostridia bacterium]|nr:hypothetical protein [Clostridia bacterium]
MTPMKLEFVSAVTTVEPVALAYVKTAIGEDYSDHDTLIGGLITSAREEAEDFLNLSLVQKNWLAAFDCWPPSRIRLPNGPLVSLGSVVVTDVNGAVTTISDQYITDLIGGGIVLKESAGLPSVTLREVNGIQISYTAGYTADNCPQKIKDAICLWVKGRYYDIPESEWRGAFERSLWPERRVPI